MATVIENPDARANGRDEADGTASLVAPVAVRVFDLGAPLDDIVLPPSRGWESYRSLLAVGRQDAYPPVLTTFTVDSDGYVPRERLVAGLRQQLEAGLAERRAHAARRRDAHDGAARVLAPKRVVGPAVSVVVPTCANPTVLERCLRSILACDYENFEVIVVENRPRGADTAQMLASRFPDESRIRYVEEPRPGASRARNAGLAEAEGELVAFADDDVVVDRAWLRASVAALGRAEDIACVTGLILPLELESESQLLMEQFAGFGKGLQAEVFRLAERCETDPLFAYTPGAVGSGASVVMRAEVARELGGFDPALGPATPCAGAEDLDLFGRVLRSGHAIAYEPAAIVWHQHPDGMPRLRRQVYRYGLGFGALIGKQLLRGPKRRELLRSVPAGIHYLRDPDSRKNAGKPTRYPRRLTRLERAGMAVGPFAYVLSVLLLYLRRLTGLERRGRAASPVRSWRRIALPEGRSIRIAWFEPRRVAAPGRDAAESATPGRDAAEPAAQTSRTPGLAVRASVMLAFAASAAAPLCAAVEPPGVTRAVSVFAFLLLAPGLAFVSVARGRMETGLVVGLGIATATLVAQSMLWLSAWWPRPFLYALALVCLGVLGREIAGWERLQTRASLERVRRAIGGRTAMHAAIVTCALALWGISLPATHLGHIAGLGLLNALPPTYFAAFALLLIGFALAAGDRGRDPRWLGVYVVALVIVIHATTALLYDEPRYAWVYKHIGVINAIAASGHADRQIDIYNNWPAFFAAGAWLSKLSGVSPLAYAGWAQLFFNLLGVFLVRFALRALTRDERLLWVAALLFVLGNWVGQDYLAPQAFGFAVSLLVIGLCLRCGPRAPAEAEAPLAPRAALAAGAVCFIAVLTSHQLSPVLLISTLACLCIFTRRIPAWIPASMLLLEVAWVALAWSFLSDHFKLFDPTPGSAAGALGRNVGAAPPGAALSLFSPAVVMGLVGAVAAFGAVRMVRARRREAAVAICCIGGPALAILAQSYGGEGKFRAFLFALPWLAYLGSVACTTSPVGTRDAVMSRLRLAAVSLAVGASLLVAAFGQELANHVARDDVLAETWYEQHAPVGSFSIALAPTAPARLTARYADVALGDPTSLLEEPAFTGHRLGARDVEPLKRLILAQGEHPAYVILSRGQEGYGRLNGLVPAGSAQGLAAALARSPAFRLVYSRPTAWVFEYLRARARA